MTNYDTILTSVKESFAAALENIKTAQKVLFEQANTEKANLIALLSEMRETHKAITSFGELCGDMGETLCIAADDQLDVADKISDVLDINEIPLAAYQNFVAFCDECGDEIVVGEDYDTDGKGEYVCADCIALAEENTKADPTDEADEETSEEE